MTHDFEKSSEYYKRLRQIALDRGRADTDKEIADTFGVSSSAISQIRNFHERNPGAQFSLGVKLTKAIVSLGYNPNWVECKKGANKVAPVEQPSKLDAKQLEWLGTWEWLTETQRKAAIQLAEENRRAFGKGGPPETPEANAPPSKRTGTR